ncbi:hypothetical protein E4P40_11020 [Blastococcus sp. CT_GayMR20]|uniref:hypothetical protein n=1 Tax=Blastococcus sp. CT_GayMR20 TaxID=2559609 RepID=UPI0010744319|nr:hypothetical protein [Blastococcus sp. CT_GayMR20]TFV87696.1 hypothetical protein E4P40_11020 [Blastococcus sp. CT_GayMR20]
MILTRLFATLGLAWGAALLSRPRQVLDALAPEFPADRAWLARVLGARQVAQYAVVLVAPTPAVVRVASAVELAHAASMVPVLRLPRYRRAASISGAVAAASAVVLAVVRSVRD